MHRLAYERLREWKDSPDRLPLIVKGVRHCGKTHLIETFGNDNYRNVAVFNFEDRPELCTLFQGSIDPLRLIPLLSIQGCVEINPDSTLLFFDEIQACPRALTSLKYFAEKAPEYHVICACSSILSPGSTKKNISSNDVPSQSFPVGKVQYLNLYPMDFEEFLLASGDVRMRDYLRDMDVHEQIPEFMVPTLIDRLREYQVVGGMPEAVGTWVKTHSLPAVRRVQDRILSTYADDLQKHPVDAKGTLERVWESVTEQLLRDNSRFVFGQSVEGARAADLDTSVQWLKDAGLVHMTRMVKKPAIPLSMNTTRFYKLYMCDLGLLTYKSEVPADFVNSQPGDYKEFKGVMAENMVLLELKAHLDTESYYWRSDAKAEVDFIVPILYEPVPIEVKAGSARSSKSLKSYRGRYEPRVSVKVSMDPEAVIGSVTHMPLYMVWRLGDYVRAGLESTGWQDPDKVFEERSSKTRMSGA